MRTSRLSWEMAGPSSPVEDSIPRRGHLVPAYTSRTETFTPTSLSAKSRRLARVSSFRLVRLGGTGLYTVGGPHQSGVSHPRILRHYVDRHDSLRRREVAPARRGILHRLRTLGEICSDGGPGHRSGSLPVLQCRLPTTATRNASTATSASSERLNINGN